MFGNIIVTSQLIISVSIHRDVVIKMRKPDRMSVAVGDRIELEPGPLSCVSSLEQHRKLLSELEFGSSGFVVKCVSCFLCLPVPCLALRDP